MNLNTIAALFGIGTRAIRLWMAWNALSPVIIPSVMAVENMPGPGKRKRLTGPEKFAIVSNQVDVAVSDFLGAKGLISGDLARHLPELKTELIERAVGMCAVGGTLGDASKKKAHLDRRWDEREAGLKKTGASSPLTRGEFDARFEPSLGSGMEEEQPV